MFRQIKSVLLWTLLYRFRKRLSIVAVLLSIVMLSQWIYGDIVEYLKLTGNIGYLHIVLPLKWMVILFNIGLSAYLVFTIFRQDTKKQKEKTDTPKPSGKQPLSQREKEFMTKKLKSRAERLMEK